MCGYTEFFFSHLKTQREKQSHALSNNVSRALKLSLHLHHTCQGQDCSEESLIVSVVASVNPSSTYESHNKYCDAELDDPSQFSCEQEVCLEDADKDIFGLNFVLFEIAN